jgi:hypothetical protein
LKNDLDGQSKFFLAGEAEIKTKFGSSHRDAAVRAGKSWSFCLDGRLTIESAAGGHFLDLVCPEAGNPGRMFAGCGSEGGPDQEQFKLGKQASQLAPSRSESWPASDLSRAFWRLDASSFATGVVATELVARGWGTAGIVAAFGA